MITSKKTLKVTVILFVKSRVKIIVNFTEIVEM